MKSLVGGTFARKRFEAVSEASTDHPREQQIYSGAYRQLEADQRQDDYDQAVAERFTNWTPPPPPPEPPRRSSRIARLAERCPPIPPQPWPWPRSTAADIVRELRSQVIELRATVARLRDGEP